MKTFLLPIFSLWFIPSAGGTTVVTPGITIVGQVASVGRTSPSGGTESIAAFINRIGGILLSKRDFDHYKHNYIIPDIRITLYRNGKATSFTTDQNAIWTTNVQLRDTIEVTKQNIRIDDALADEVLILKVPLPK